MRRTEEGREKRRGDYVENRKNGERVKRIEGGREREE